MFLIVLFVAAGVALWFLVGEGTAHSKGCVPCSAQWWLYVFSDFTVPIAENLLDNYLLPGLIVFAMLCEDMRSRFRK